MSTVKTAVAAFVAAGAVNETACQGRPALSDVVSLLGLLVALVALIYAYQALVIARRTQAMSGWEAANALGLEHYDLLGALTPYGVCSKQEATLRAFLLCRLNRFYTETDPRLREKHLQFRKRTMGDSLEEFRTRIVTNGGSTEIADLALKALRDIRATEPYYDDAFWDTYFHGWHWA